MSGSAPPTVLVLFVAFLVVMLLVALLSGRRRLSCAVALVIVGLAVSALPLQESVLVSPELVVAVLLPGLALEAASFQQARARTVPLWGLRAEAVVAVRRAASGSPAGDASSPRAGSLPAHRMEAAP